ncbi:DUF4349 domain-containing protein [Georgenia muralis]|uniref:Uncharacterized protein DUF4349 n=1 Tax=Georgenia muralis TaxID=154117 RepID=A0A3N4Z2B1_9MICO|nr:DUF4349 domain-containing protein [Georgenia muralis]RPF27389.1 uncharacterized protein DUF4349 [Georgenia muralis]
MRLLRRLPALLVLLLLLTSCSMGGGDTASEESAGGGGVGAPGGGEGGDGAVTDSDGDGEVIDGDRQVISTGSMTLVVEDPAAAADEVTALVRAAGGRVDERSERAGGDGLEPSAWLVVRVPSDELDDTLDALAELGEQRDLDIGSVDVTGTARDLDARIGALEASVDRLLGLLADAQSSEALIAAESALNERQSELEALKAERRHIGEQVAMATVSVQLVARSSPTLEPSGFLGGLRTGWDALVSFVGAVLVTLGVLVPWIALAAVVTAIALPLWRRRRRAAPPRPGGRAPAPAQQPPAQATAPQHAPPPRQPPTGPTGPPSGPGAPPVSGA